MIQESEILRLILGTIVAVILTMSASGGLRRLPGRKLFTSAYYVLLSGWLFTVFEHLVFYDILNILEHIAYLASGALYATWCWSVFHRTLKP